MLRALTLLLPCAAAAAQVPLSPGTIQGANVQQLANGMLGIMSYMVAPDVTTGSLSIDNGSTANADLFLTQLGGGFTWSRELPVYLEGNAAFARFDPVFLVTDGTEQRRAPTRWNSLALTGGIGWDFPMSEHWVVRPIFNFMVGSVASDLQVARWWVDSQVDQAVKFLDGGELQAYGLGGALMLDYEKSAPDAEHELEIRYTNVDLRSNGSSSKGVEGRAKTESLSIWARLRVPTGWGQVWDRPVRYVYKAAFTRFYGS